VKRALAGNKTNMLKGYTVSCLWHQSNVLLEGGNAFSQAKILSIRKPKKGNEGPLNSIEKGLIGILVYQTTDGKKYVLGTMPRKHQDFLRRVYWHYCANTPYEQFVVFILGPQSPVLKPKENGPTPTRTPLYEVVTDLQGRLGVKQGLMAKDWEGDIDPLWPLSD
jgi:hypothetical protein